MEYKQLKKGITIKLFKLIDGKIIDTLTVGGNEVSNPTLDMMYADGWEDYIPPTPPPYEPTREEAINAEIRAKYTDNDEFQILRQYSADPSNSAYKAAFDEYHAFVEEILSRYPAQNE